MDLTSYIFAVLAENNLDEECITPTLLVTSYKTKVPPEDDYSSHDMRHTSDSNKGSCKGWLNSRSKSQTRLILENQDVLPPGYIIPGERNLNGPIIVVEAVTHSTTIAKKSLELTLLLICDIYSRRIIF